MAATALTTDMYRKSKKKIEARGVGCYSVENIRRDIMKEMVRGRKLDDSQIMKCNSSPGIFQTFREGAKLRK